MHHVSVTDEDLASGIEAGELEAMEFLVERYHRPILRYLWQVGGSKEDAEDLATQSLLRVRSDIRGYRNKGSLRSWIFKVAYRELLRHRRRQKIARLLAPRTQEHADPPTEDAVVIAQALTKIPIEQRAAFLLTEVEGLSIDEVAAALGVPPGTVKSRCHNARKKLQSLLGPTYGEPHAEPIAK